MQTQEGKRKPRKKKKAVLAQLRRQNKNNNTHIEKKKTIVCCRSSAPVAKVHTPLLSETAPQERSSAYQFPTSSLAFVERGRGSNTFSPLSFKR